MICPLYQTALFWSSLPRPQERDERADVRVKFVFFQNSLKLVNFTSVIATDKEQDLTREEIVW